MSSAGQNLRIFISHSSADRETAAMVIELIRGALRLGSREIRCTSVDGYRLPGGASTNEQLRMEVLEAEAFLGIMSGASLKSAYVAFELGARWGAGKHLVPILVPGLSASRLEGPLSGINALKIKNPAEMHQLVHDLAGTLGIEAEPAAAYQRIIDQLSKIPEEVISVSSPVPPSQKSSNVVSSEHSTSPDNLGLDSDLPPEVFQKIRAKAAADWPDDFEMRLHTEEEQARAYRELVASHHSNVPEDVFNTIRRKAAAEWPDDFEMRLHTEKEQIIAFKRLRR